MKRPILFLLLLLLSLLAASCAGESSTNTIPPAPPTPSAVPTQAPIEAPTPTTTPTLLPASKGPTLLLQTDFEAYEIIDFGLEITYPITLTGLKPSDRLGGMLSPGRSQLLLVSDQGEIQILDLPTGDTESIERPLSDAFQTEQAAKAAMDALDAMKYSDEAALEAVKSAYEQSTRIVRWDQDDKHLFIASSASAAGTQLTSLDLATGERTTLERESGILENFWVRGEKILIKKGYAFEPSFWQDDAYFVLDRNSGEVTAIPVPADADRPAISWLGTDSLKITHQTDPAGGIGFSIMDLDTLTWEPVVEGAFSSINAYQDGWLLFTQDTTARTTRVQRLNVEGEHQTETTLPEPCLINTILGETILANCETESLKMDGDLNTASFSDPIFLLSGAPDGQTWILVTRTGATYRLASDLAVQESLSLEGTPLEVRWLPDSGGFLYRTKGRLYHYDLARGISLEILVSDLLNDYTNFNAVWINLD